MNHKNRIEIETEEYQIDKIENQPEIVKFSYFIKFQLKYNFKNDQYQGHEKRRKVLQQLCN